MSEIEKNQLSPEFKVTARDISRIQSFMAGMDDLDQFVGATPGKPVKTTQAKPRPGTISFNPLKQMGMI